MNNIESLLQKIENKIVAIICNILEIEPEELDNDVSFAEYGVDSLIGLKILDTINKELGLELRSRIMYDYSTVNALSVYIGKTYSDKLSHLNEKDNTVIEPETFAPVEIDAGSDRLSSENNDTHSSPETLSSMDITADIEHKIVTITCTILEIEPEELDKDVSFAEYGVDSLIGLKILDTINKELGLELKSRVMYDYSTISALSTYIGETYSDKLSHLNEKDTAVIEPETFVPVEIDAGSDRVSSENNDTHSSSETISSMDIATDITADIEHKIVTITCTILEIEPEELDRDVSFAEYGVDSLIGLKILDTINKELGLELKSRVMYDYSTINTLSTYVVENHAHQLISVKDTTDRENNVIAKNINKQSTINKLPDIKIVEENDLNNNYSQNNYHSNDDVAVIGISGQFPGAPDTMSFWNNLKNSVDSITEIPSDRWNISQFFDSDPQKKDKTYCKWGGFITDIDKFDPLFFKISPSEAIVMDPKQRLFLMEAWKAIEDAGYNPFEVKNHNCGIFVGTLGNQYANMLKENIVSNQYAKTMIGNLNSIIAARLAYFLNIKGPVLTVDTACASALTAIHLGCKSIREKECKIAIAGGIALYLNEKSYINISKTGVLSSHGKCRAFDNDADGMIPGEGVGVVLLKSLADAIKDKDNIYGVIKGSGINHDGKTNGITAPSGVSQEELLVNIYKKFDINPENITYVEAHGTGTKLGDPVEVAALSRAFNKFTKKTNYCAIGSVKTNIGHTSAAAGIVSLIKVLLSLKNKQLPASLNYNSPNEHIDFENSPFYVNSTLQDWKREDTRQRLSAISSFGFSGTNCHIVVGDADSAYENYIPDMNLDSNIVLLSAENEETLKNYAKSLLDYLEDTELSKDTRLTNIAYTLQVGRPVFDHKLAFVVKNKAELHEKLQQFCDNRQDIKKCFYGKDEINMGNIKLDHLFNGAEGDDYIKNLIKNRKNVQLAKLWVFGIKIDWKLLYNNIKIQKVSLPTYPFLKTKYWFTQLEEEYDDKRSDVTQFISPLISQNVSTLKEQKFVSTFYGDEFFLEDHVINNQKLLPGAAYIEMARLAAQLSGETGVGNIKGITWATPFIFEKDDNQKKKDIFTSINVKKNRISFKIYSENQEKPKSIHASGMLEFTDGKRTISDTPIDIETTINKFENHIEGRTFYDQFKNAGICYGNSFQTIEKIYFNDKEALSSLALPSEYTGNLNDFVLHPALLDGALQTVLSIGGNINDLSGDLYLPFSMEDIEIINPLQSPCYAFAVKTNHKEKIIYYNVTLLDKTGNVLVKITNFSVRPIKFDHGLIYYTSDWEKSLMVNKTNISHEPVLIFIPTEHVNTQIIQTLNEKLSNNLVLVSTGKSFEQIHDNHVTINYHSESDYTKLFNWLKSNNIVPQNIIHAWSTDASLLKYSLETKLDISVMSLFFIVKMIIQIWKNEDVKILFTYPGSNEMNPVFQSVCAFLKNIRLEKPNIVGKSLEIEDLLENSIDAIVQELNGESFDDFEVRYKENQRYTKVLKEVQTPDNHHNEFSFEKNKTYVITGGLGKLGLIFARYLCEIENSTIILTGRSEISPENEEMINQLNLSLINNSKVIYIQSDISNKDNVQQLVAHIKNSYKKIDGIIHSAGITNDSLIMKKTKDHIDTVLKPKVYGIYYLDEALKDEKLDFFVGFSSLGAIFSNYGQCDYSYANSFIDNFIEYRKELVKKQLRSGISLSINWPFWKNGGMVINDQAKHWMKTQLGMEPLLNQSGITAFKDCFNFDKSHIIVLEGDKTKIRSVVHKGSPQEFFKQNITEPAPKKPKTQISEVKNSTQEQAEAILKTIISKEMKIPYDKLNVHTSFDKYGIDSITILNLNKALESDFEDLPRTLFFEYQNIFELASYLTEYFPEKFIDDTTINNTEQSIAVEEYDNQKNNFHQNRFVGFDGGENESDDIAIIGLSGRYPQSNSLNEFWEKISQGTNCITEIPEKRWDSQKYFSEEPNALNKTYSKWGGFIDDVDKFDPLFFSISPTEAIAMDPQERLMLETVWHTLEDAGYTREWFKKNNLNDKVGVYIGSMYMQYPWVNQNKTQGALQSNNSYWSIPNRISYFFNFKGPSIAIDTACSSSLTALHLACESIKRGECLYSIAGGVNITIHPAKYIGLSQAQILGSDGMSKSLGDGDGYVPGEGVGAVLLKPLKKAINDNDKIYGVIKSTVINHGGKTNGFMVPSPKEQSVLIEKTLHKSGLKPTDINYIECAATGSKLGDAIEINALKKVFKNNRDNKNTIPIGTVKSNMGHLEAASGLSQLTKVLLQMNYKKLCPSINSTPVNPDIDLNNSSFYIADTLVDWNPEDNKYALINSFGAGGSYGCMIIKDHPGQISNTINDNENNTIKNLFIYSARDTEQLNALLARYIDFIETTEHSITDIAYTLQVGRENMEQRLAIVAESKEELLTLIKDVLNGKAGNDNIFTGVVDSMENTVESINKHLQNYDYKELIKLWISGVTIDWDQLWNNNGKRISLPLYPFSKERYWISDDIMDDDMQSTIINEEKTKNNENFNVISIISELLRINKEKLNEDKKLEEYGFNSLLKLRLMKRLEQYYEGINIKEFFEKRTIRDIVQSLKKLKVVERDDKKVTYEKKMLEVIDELTNGTMSPEDALKIELESHNLKSSEVTQ